MAAPTLRSVKRPHGDHATPPPSSSTYPSPEPKRSGSTTEPGQPPEQASRSTSETDSPANNHQPVASASHTEGRTVSTATPRPRSVRSSSRSTTPQRQHGHRQRDD